MGMMASSLAASYFNVSAEGTTALHFGYDSITKMSMTLGGKVGIGTTDPANSSTLDVRGRVSVHDVADGELQFGTTATYTWMEAFDGSADRSPKLPITINPWGR